MVPDARSADLLAQKLSHPLTPELGTAAMVENMRKMMRWHLEEFDTCPIGDGFEVDVTEFDFHDENGVSYERNRP